MGPRDGTGWLEESWPGEGLSSRPCWSCPGQCPRWLSSTCSWWRPRRSPWCDPRRPPRQGIWLFSCQGWAWQRHWLVVTCCVLPSYTGLHWATLGCCVSAHMVAHRLGLNCERYWGDEECGLGQPAQTSASHPSNNIQTFIFPERERERERESQTSKTLKDNAQ